MMKITSKIINQINILSILHKFNKKIECPKNDGITNSYNKFNQFHHFLCNWNN